MFNDGARQILRILREHFGPYGVDAMYRGAFRFMHSKRADQTMDVYLLEFEFL